MKKIYQLENSIKNYAWGSTDALAQLLGVENKSDEPQAELWMGVHGGGESLVDYNGQMRRLSQVLAEDNGSNLGPKIKEKYGSLPFLFKILAIEKPLSIQVHPTKAQAVAGFARENQLGIAINAPNRNYKDSSHKPEIVCAISDEFWLLSGFKPIEKIVEEFCIASLPMLQKEVANLAENPTYEEFQLFLRHLLTMGSHRSTILAAQAAEYAAGQTGVQYSWIEKLHNLYPEDSGVLAPLYLNTFCLNYGQALYLESGVPHAYLEGVAAELMSNSDNVLRGGLTPKYIDSREFLHIANFASFNSDILQANAHTGCFETPSDEFVLQHIILDKDRFINAKNPCQILICIKGKARLETVKGGVDSDKQKFSINIKRGDVVLIPYAAGGYNFIGKGEFFAAQTK